MEEILTIQARRQPGHVLVAVAGEIDIVSGGRLRRRLTGLAAGGGSLVADLGQVSFIDVAGLRVLARTARQAAAHGGS